MKCFLVVCLAVLLPLQAVAADNGYKVTYDGGSLSGLRAGNKAVIYIESNQIRLAHDNSDSVLIPASAVTEISYGEDVHRRVGAAIGLAVVSFGVGALMALSKSKKHFIGLTWTDGTTHGGFAMQCEKGDYRGILTGLEGVTGKKSVDSASMTVKN